MEEKQKPIKMKLHTFVIIIAVVVIALMAIFMYIQKRNSEEKIKELQAEAAQLQSTVNKLQEDYNETSKITINSKDESEPINQSKPATKSNKDSSTTEIVKESKTELTKVLSKYKEVVESYNYDTGWIENMYAICDLDKNSIPELLIYTCKKDGNVINAYTTVFMYDANKNDIINIGKIDGRIDLNTSLYMMNDGTILVVYGYMGYEKTTYYKYENNKLLDIGKSTEKKVGDAEEYLEGDSIIEFKNCNDNSLVNNYK